MDLTRFKLGSTLNSLPTITMVRPKLKSFNLSSFPQTAILKKISPKKVALSLIVVAVILAGVFIALSQFGQKTTFTQNITAEVPIGKTFKFPILDANGKPTKNFITMNLTTVAKMKNILIQGKPATARAGKSFLIINLELTNDLKQRVNLTPVDLIRLVDASGKKFAPDVHNETVAVEPISVKKTRVGFVINEVSSGFKLQVGEIDGPKETISLAI